MRQAARPGSVVLLWGILGDTPMARVREALRTIGARVVLVDQQRILQTDVELSVDGHVDGRLRTGDGEIDLGHVDAVYVRPYDVRRIRAVAGAGPTSSAWAHALLVDSALAIWTELTDAVVVNRLSSMSSNDSKPYQSQLIHASGFAVPETLVTTDPEAVEEFWQKHRSVIYKSVSGVRSIVSRLCADDRAHLRDVMTCPTQFQELIAGTDVRIHVVGEDVFGCEIESAADDYRYAARQGAADARLSAYEVPAELADRCRRLAADLDLQVAGIDLRRSAEGRWYCFEVNPSPAFTYYESATGCRIGQAIARLLASGE